MLKLDVTMRTKTTAEQKWLEQFQKDVRHQAQHLHVGVIDAVPHSAAPGYSVADIAASHELGDGRVPQRSWLRGFFGEKGSEVQRMAEASAKRTMARNADLAEFLGVFGSLLVSGIRARMTEGISPALSAFTLQLRKARGVTRTTPLIDTGQLINSIAIRVLGKRKQVP
jgi:hypothetical protein